MKKSILLFSSILMLLGPSRAIFAQEETESQASESEQTQLETESVINDIFEDKTWWLYSNVSVNDTTDKSYKEYVEKFDTLTPSNELASYFKAIIRQIGTTEKEDFEQKVARAVVTEIKKNDNENFVYRIYDYQEDNLDTEETNEIINNNSNQLYEFSTNTESDENEKRFLLKNKDALYIITKAEPTEEGRESLNYEKYIASDNEELQPLKDSIDGIKAEREVETVAEETNAFNPDDYPYETDYDSIMRSSDDKIGEKINIYGTVLQVQEDKESNFITLRVATQGSYDGVYLVYMIKPEVRILEDDVVDIYGSFLGVDSYTAVLGNSITVPTVFASEVWVQGIDF